MSQMKTSWTTLLESAQTEDIVEHGTVIIVGGSEYVQQRIIERMPEGQDDKDYFNIKSTNSNGNSIPGGNAASPLMANAFALGHSYIEYTVDGAKVSDLEIYTLDGTCETYGTANVKMLQRVLARTNRARNHAAGNGHPTSSPTDSPIASISSAFNITMTSRTTGLPDSANTIGADQAAASNASISSAKVAACVILDWSEVWKWAGQLESWIKCLNKSTKVYDRKTVEDELADRLQTYGSPKVSSTTSGPVKVPLEPGQYSAPLGIDLVIVCANSERSSMYRSEIAEFAQQFVRTVAYVHGGSVVSVSSAIAGSAVTTSSTVLSSASTLAPSSLHPSTNFTLTDVLSERLEMPLGTDKPVRTQPNAVDLVQIMVPAGWDSRQKILSLNDEFPINEVVDAWQNSDTRQQAVGMYQKLVPSNNLSDQLSNLKLEPPVTPIDIQAILGQYYKK